MYLLHWVRLSAADTLSASTELKGIAATAATRKTSTSISFERTPTLSHPESARNRPTPNVTNRGAATLAAPRRCDPRWGWLSYAAARSTANEGSAVPFGDTIRS